ncbi:MAG: acyl-CoA/acyl-ACP dehydrogenase [Deltaproteobacteria bacterium]|nr:acyl-CoA/acyl-ACP dehydrogenase [Deltaproteobacteria bacterium]
MDFSLTLEQNVLKETFTEFLSKECPFDVIREIKTSDEGYSKKTWRKMADLGWMGLGFEEKYGGSEGSFLDLFILFEEIGKVLLPSPLFTSAVMSGLLLSEAGSEEQKGKYLPRIINGKQIFTVALLDGKGRTLPTVPETVAIKNDAGDYTVSGSYLLVPYVNVSDHIFFIADIRNAPSGGPTIFMATPSSKELTFSAVDTITDEKKYAIRFDNVTIPAKNIIGGIGQGDFHLKRMLSKAIVIKCAEMIGGFNQAMDMTVAYAAKRKQFGVPIGKFQAIQHYCADMAIDLKGAQLMAYQAASMMSEGIACEKEVAMAKAWCSDTYRKATQICQQIHGGVGFTDEFNIGLFYKHAKECELMFGHSKIHRSKVAYG